MEKRLTNILCIWCSILIFTCEGLCQEKAVEEDIESLRLESAKLIPMYKNLEGWSDTTHKQSPSNQILYCFFSNKVSLFSIHTTTRCGVFPEGLIQGGRRFIAGGRFEHTTTPSYSNSAGTIDNRIKEGSSSLWRGFREWPWFGAPLKSSPRRSAIADDPFPSARSSELCTASPAIGI